MTVSGRNGDDSIPEDLTNCAAAAVTVKAHQRETIVIGSRVAGDVCLIQQEAQRCLAATSGTCYVYSVNKDGSGERRLSPQCGKRFEPAGPGRN